MGTNYYARLMPKEEDKEMIMNAIIDNNVNKVKDIAKTLCSQRDDAHPNGHIIHLGKRSSGWKFLWNPNVIKIRLGRMGKDSIYHYEHLYSLTLEGIKNFIMQENVVIYDEYDQTWNKEAFLSMALNWGTDNDGYDSKTYEDSKNPSYPLHYWSERHQRYVRSSEEEMWLDLGHNVLYYDFYSDNLRFATSIVFS